jgi:hydrogenase maturation protease
LLNGPSEGNLAAVLIFAYGNPARGDDGLGPRFIELMQPVQEHAQFDTITDYQLQVEHSLDLLHRRQVIFVDASVSATAPFEFTPVLPSRDNSYTSHAMSPAALLAVYEQVCDQALPDTSILSIRGYEFELGTPISARAQINLDQAARFLLELLISADMDKAVTE